MTQSDENPEVELYNDDALTPVYEWKNVAYSFEELITILLKEHSKEHLCVAPPINVAHNVAFLIENSKMKKSDDLKCDDMGAWIHTGSPKLPAKVTYDRKGKINEIIRITNDDHLDSRDSLILKRIYYVNKSSNDVRKILSTLQGKLR